MSLKKNVTKVPCVHCGKEFAKTGIKKHEETCKQNPDNVDNADGSLEEQEYEDENELDEDDLDDSEDNDLDDSEDGENEDSDEEGEDDEDSDEDSDEEEADDDESDDDDSDEAKDSEDEQGAVQGKLKVMCLVRFSFFWMGSNYAMRPKDKGVLPEEFAKDMSRKGYVEILL